jgi:hypothetical protein
MTNYCEKKKDHGHAVLPGAQLAGFLCERSVQICPEEIRVSTAASKNGKRNTSPIVMKIAASQRKRRRAAPGLPLIRNPVAVRKAGQVGERKAIRNLRERAGRRAVARRRASRHRMNSEDSR